MGFRNSVVRGIRLVREAIQSPNYDPGVEGWTINKDGTSEFGSATIRGTVVAGPLTGSHIIIEPSVAVGFNNGELQAVIRMFPDDPNFMMEGMLGVVTFDAGQADAQMSSVLHSPVPMTQGYGIVLAADADDMSIPANGSLGIVTVDGMAMTFTPVMMAETYGVASRTFLTYGEQAGQSIEAFGSTGITPWLCPPGVTSVKVECWGGGGHGGRPGTGGGGGGGGGEYASEVVAVTPGNTYNLIVGAGSIPGSPAAGGTSTFPGDVVTVLAHGGNSSTGTAGATGGSGSTNTIHHNGGNGSSGSTTNGSGGGGAAGTTANGNSAIDSNGVAGGVTGGGRGGNGGLNNGRAGANGAAPGGGGGGIGAGTSPDAGTGGDGVVRLTYSRAGTTIIASMSGDSGVDRFGNAYSSGVYQETHRVMDRSTTRVYPCALTVALALAAGGYNNIVGMTISFTTLFDNAECQVTATFDTNTTAAGAAGDLALYQLLLDGVAFSQTPLADIRTIHREMVPGVWSFTVPLAGTHTLQFQGRKSAGSLATVSATTVTVGSLTVVDNHGGI